MSAGEFIRSFYEVDYAPGTAIHPIRVQEETLDCVIGGVQNESDAVAATNPIRAKVGKGKREIGLGPRMVTLKFTGGSGDPPTGGAPEGYTGDNVTIPALTKDFAAACTEGATGTYLGANVEVVSLSPEDVN